MNKIKPLMLVFILLCTISFINTKADVIKKDINDKPILQVNKSSDYLNTSDIEKVAHIKGVKLIPKNPLKGAGGDLNFATNEGKLILMVQIVNKSNYEGYKKYFFKSDIKDLGIQAMEGGTLPDRENNLVVFTKGDKCIALTVFADLNDTNKNMLSVEQTIKLAKIIANRIE